MFRVRGLTGGRRIACLNCSVMLEEKHDSQLGHFWSHEPQWYVSGKKPCTRPEPKIGEKNKVELK